MPTEPPAEPGDDRLAELLEEFLCRREEEGLSPGAYLDALEPALDGAQRSEFLARLAALALVEDALARFEHDPPLARGSRLGRYEILGLIGRGGMGEVYRARDPRLAREVALKVLASSRQIDPRMRRRFEREAAAAGALSHPDLVTVFDLEEIDGRLLLTMEFVPGRTLRDLAGDDGPNAEQRVRILARIARAVAHAHAAGIVHRDLKPENLMLTPTGEPKVLDFGLAKNLAPAGPGPTTHTGQVLGTSWYMSPEQIRGAPIGPASDQFSLAIVLFEWLSGERPFRGDSAYDTVEAIVQVAPARLRLEEPWAAEIERVLMRALEKRPEQRYPDLLLFAEDLERALSGGRATGGRAPREERVAWREALRAAALLLGILLAGKLVLDGQRPDPEQLQNLPSLGYLAFERADGSPTDAWAEELDKALAFELRRISDELGFHLLSPSVLADATTLADRLELSRRYGALMVVPRYASLEGTLTVWLALVHYDGDEVRSITEAVGETLVTGNEREAPCGRATRSALNRLRLSLGLARPNV